MFSELDVLRDVGQRLERSGVPFMLTGSLALAYYATPRMTRDIDIVVAVDCHAPRSLHGLFHPDYYVDEADIARAVETAGQFNILHVESVIKVDLVVRKDDPYRRLEFDRRQRARLAGVETWIVSKEDLILSKLAWARESRSELQLRDVSALLQTGADREYLLQWAPVLRVADLLAEAST